MGLTGRRILAGVASGSNAVLKISPAIKKPLKRGAVTGNRIQALATGAGATGTGASERLAKAGRYLDDNPTVKKAVQITGLGATGVAALMVTYNTSSPREALRRAAQDSKNAALEGVGFASDGVLGGLDFLGSSLWTLATKLWPLMLAAVIAFLVMK
jgi:hypothetical protein